MSKKDRKKKKNNIFLVVFYSLLSLLLISTLSIKIGDRLLEKDKVSQAKVLYTIGKFTNPFTQNIDQRLLGANIVDIERKTHSEETDGDELAMEDNLNKNVLGAGVTIPVLMYHYIRVNPDPNDRVGFNLSVTPDNFDSQMEYLSTHGYHAINLDELGSALLSQAPLPAKPIVITLDDGYRDSYTAAFPILRKYNLKAVDFVITGVVGAPLYLTWDQISEMANSGVFTFGSHTVHHSALTYLTRESIVKEVSESKQDLQTHLGHTINWFAYPYGNVNAQVAEVVKESGYIGAFGTNRGTYESTDHLFTLPRVRIGGTDSVSSLAAKLPW